MSFIEKIQNTITGKTSEQRANDRLATSIASRQIQKAAFEERSRQMTRVAVEKEKLRADNMLKKARESYNRPSGGFISPMGKGFSSPVGGSTFSIFGDRKPTASSFNPISGVWGSMPSAPGKKRIKRVKHRRARPRRRARRVVYVRKYV